MANRERLRILIRCHSPHVLMLLISDIQLASVINEKSPHLLILRFRRLLFICCLLNPLKATGRGKRQIAAGPRVHAPGPDCAVGAPSGRPCRAGAVANSGTETSLGQRRN